MAGFATLEDVRNAPYLDRRFLKTRTGGYQDLYFSTWRIGSMPAIGADPAAGSGTPGAGGSTYVNAAGGLCFPDMDPVRKFLARFVIAGGTAATPCNGFIFDRLVGVSGLTLNSTGDKDVNSVALPRYTDGAGVEAFLEITTAGATTTPAVSLASYTNQDGVGSHVGGSLAFNVNNTAVNTWVGPLPLQVGDTGIRSVELLNVGTAGGGSGVCNLVLAVRLAMVTHDPDVNEIQGPLPVAHLGRIYDGATLQVCEASGIAGSYNLLGMIRAIYG